MSATPLPQTLTSFFFNLWTRRRRRRAEAATRRHGGMTSPPLFPLYFSSCCSLLLSIFTRFSDDFLSFRRASSSSPASSGDRRRWEVRFAVSFGSSSHFHLQLRFPHYFSILAPRSLPLFYIFFYFPVKPTADGDDVLELAIQNRIWVPVSILCTLLAFDFSIKTVWRVGVLLG